MEIAVNDETARARSALLDALAALRAHRDSLILVGAQAIYLRTGAARVALAEFTTDADLVVDPRRLEPHPLLEVVLAEGGVMRDPANGNPGAWVSPGGVPIDLMVPDALAGPGRRAARVPPHDPAVMRRTIGLEAALVDNSVMNIRSMDSDDDRAFEVRVAGPAALLIAKLHKVNDRRADPQRRNAKDAHDIHRILVSVKTEDLVQGFERARDDPVSAGVTSRALALLADLFASGPDSVGSAMAGEAEAFVGDPAQTSLASSILATDLLRALDS